VELRGGGRVARGGVPATVVLPLASLVNGVREQHRDDQPSRPQAAPPECVGAEELAGQNRRHLLERAGKVLGRLG
jgi:hypothetical protein